MSDIAKAIETMAATNKWPSTIYPHEQIRPGKWCMIAASLKDISIHVSTDDLDEWIHHLPTATVKSVRDVQLCFCNYQLGIERLRLEV